MEFLFEDDYDDEGEPLEEELFHITMTRNEILF